MIALLYDLQCILYAFDFSNHVLSFVSIDVAINYKVHILYPLCSIDEVKLGDADA
jgi:hypothetical protein